MLEQDGDKPQLKLVSGADDQLPEIIQPYLDHVAEVLKALRLAKANGESIKVSDYLTRLSPDEDNGAICDFLVGAGEMTKLQFTKAMEGVRQQDKLQSEVGFIPHTVLDLVEKYTGRKGISLTAKGTLRRKVVVNLGPDTIDETILEQPNGDPAKYLYQLAAAEQETLESLRRELRLLSGDYCLGFSDQQISDAVKTWEVNTRRLNKFSMFQDVRFEKGRATGPIGQAMWKAMEMACFDVTDTAPGFAIAVIQKFMWQVKKKALGLDVTRHLMPVITGAQERGKSTFVEQMTKPLQDTMMRLDFKLLTDGKTMSIWANHILFLDEMGGFTKADVDAVKNIITSPELPFRVMRQNDAEPVKQQSTLIGCSNKSLAQLVRDDTGVRRFAELAWRMEPDWPAMNKIDWLLLWQSVDEFGDDPVERLGMLSYLTAQQADNRINGPVETWARRCGPQNKDWRLGHELHATYREWEEDNYPNCKMDVNSFGRNMTGLIKNIPNFPFEKKRFTDGVKYRYNAALEVK